MSSTKTSASTAAVSAGRHSDLQVRTHDEQIAATMFRDPEAVDRILSRELQELSFVTRTEINEEVHGVRCLAPEETPQLLEGSLNQLDHELSLLQQQQPHQAAAYTQALSLPQSYVRSVDFRLRFLRAELFEPKKAAARLAMFLGLALDLFGPIALERPIRISDLNKQDLAVIRGGDIQPLPFRDRSGRRVVVAVNQFCMQYPLQNKFKANLYMHWAMSEDVESQKKGFVAVLCWPANVSLSIFNKSGPGSTDSDYSSKFFAAIPWRLCSMHLCFPDKPVFHFIRSGLAWAMGDSRLRLTFHYGESIENMYKLRGYGIPSDQLPVSESGNIKTKNLHQWIRIRRVSEGTSVTGNDQGQAFPTIECPGSNDAIFRCGQAYLSHPGNVMFRCLIESKFEEHNRASTSDAKVAITWWIIEQVERNQGRFLIWDNGWWKQMTDKQKIRSKVAIAFKDHKRRMRALTNCQVHESSTFKFESQDGRKRKSPDVLEDDSAMELCGRIW